MFNRGCIVRRVDIQLVIEKYMNIRKTMHCTFIDLEKAYDKLNIFELWNVLCKYGTEIWLLTRTSYPYIHTSLVSSILRQDKG